MKAPNMRAILLLPLILAACTAVPPPREDGEARFARELAGRTPGPPERCIPSDGQSSLQVVDSATLAYRRGRTLWLNRLPSVCPGMRRGDALVVEMFGSSYCRGDIIRPVRPYSAVPGPTCVLGEFVPYRR